MQISLTPPPAATPPMATPGVTAQSTDVARFEEVFYLEPVDALPGTAPLEMDHAFFNGLEAANRKHDAMVRRLDAALDEVVHAPELSISSLLRVQVELATVSFHEHLTVKVVDKTSEGIKTLFRNQ